MSTAAAEDQDLPVTDPGDPRLDGWYHTIELADGIVTRGVFDHRPVLERFGLPASLSGMDVLDVGTGDGFFAFEMERRGAERVVAIDVPSLAEIDWVPRMRDKLRAVAPGVQPWADRFRIARATLGSRVEYRAASVYDLTPESAGTFDLVFCGSLLLHLHDPLRALMRIRSVTRDLAVVETAVDPRLEESHPGEPVLSFGAFAEAAVGEENTYWLLTTSALERMLVYAGFAQVEPRGMFDLGPTGPRVTVVAARVE